MDASLLSLLSPQNKAIVIDIGAKYTKCGFSGDMAPRVIPTELRTLEKKEVVLNTSQPSVSKNELEEAFFFFLQKLIVRELLSNPKESRVIVCESTFVTKPVRDAIAAALFGRLAVPSAVFLPAQAAAIFATSAQSALIVDVGHTETTILPMSSRVVLKNAMRSFPVGGASIAERLQDLLKEYPAQFDIQASGEQKRDVLQVLERELDVQSIDELIETRMSFEPVPDEPFRFVTAVEPHRVLSIQPKMLQLAANALFEPDDDGKTLPAAILDSVAKCNVDVRKQLTSIVLLGSVTRIPGFQARLLQELNNLLSSTDSFIRRKWNLDHLSGQFKALAVPFNAGEVGWIGASLLSVVDTLLRNDEISRTKYLKFREVPDWTFLLDSARKATLFRADEPESDLLAF